MMALKSKADLHEYLARTLLPATIVSARFELKDSSQPSPGIQA